MEEILASIRRIISEDEAPAEAEAPAAAEPPPPAPEPEPEPAPVAAAPAPEPEPEPEEDDVMDLTQVVDEPAASTPAASTLGDLEISAAPPPPPPPQPAPAPAPAPMTTYHPQSTGASSLSADEPLLSPAAAADVSSAFGSLAQRIGMPPTSTTLDGVVRELLRPLLKDWLDQHLRPIVEAKVEEEVERQSRRARI